MERSLLRFVLVAAATAFLSFSPTAFGWLDPAQPDVITVLDSQDAGMSAISSEQEYNFGGSTSRRVKGQQDLMWAKFDLSAHQGKTVEAAELHLCKASGDNIMSLVVSTFNTDWQEGTQSWTREVGSPCYRWRVTPVNSSVYTTEDNEWTYAHSDATSAAFGNFGSLVSYGFTATDTFRTYTSGSNTWVAMKVDPAVIQALMIDQYGLAITDARWHNSPGGNPVAYTKNQNSTVQPRLYIKFATATDTTPPGAVAGLNAQAGPESGQAVLNFQAPSDPQAPKAFGYTVRYSTTNDFAAATNLARWRIPRPRDPGVAQRVLIEGLTPGTTYYFFVQAYDAVGNAGTVETVNFAPPTITTPTLADGPFTTPDPAGKSIQTVTGVMRWWAAPECTRVNPVTGNRADDGYTGSGADNYQKANVVWYAGTNTISLLAARNEVVGAQVIIEKLTAGSLTNVGVTAGNLTGPGGAVIPAASCIELFQMFYVTSGSTYYAEQAIPLVSQLGTTFNIPDTNRNPSASAKNQTVWMDIYVPKSAGPGDYTGTLTVTATQLTSPVTINVAVHVSRIIMPDYPTFLVDLNAYGNYWNWSSTDEALNDRLCIKYFQAAHKHRVVPNTLPYSHLNGRVQSDRVPDTMTGSGSTLHAASWATFDRRYGPLFDGSAFSPSNPVQPYVGPGQNTPITHFYSTFHESWPIYILDPVLGFDALGLGPAYWYGLNPGNLVTMFTNLPDVWSAFPDGYKQGLRNVMADWVQHAHDKGWTRTSFETYHNNKYYLSWSTQSGMQYDPVFWVMEENDGADDFRADGFWHQLWRDGYAQANCPDVKWHFRIDISTNFGLNYGQLDNRINYWDLGASFANMYWPQTKYRNYYLDADKQEEWIDYSDQPSATGSGLAYSQVFLRRWSQGLIGVLPIWDAMGYTSWTGFGNPPSVIYSGKAGTGGMPGLASDYEGCFLSMRLKQMRQAEQLIELLNLWGGTVSTNYQQVRNSVFAKYGNGSWDYGYGGVDDIKLYRMRSDLLAKLETILVPGDIDYSGAVDVIDLLWLIDSFGAVSGDPNYDPACDLDYSGGVDVIDLLTMIDNWPAS